MSKWSLTLIAALCSFVLAVPGASLAQEVDLAVDLEVDPVALAAAGWSEEAPGVWTRTEEDGQRRLRAQGPEALAHVLAQLRERAQGLLDGDLSSRTRARRLAHTLSLIAEIEEDLARPLIERRPPCNRKGSITVWAQPGPACGVEAYALVEVNSSYCLTDCSLYAGSYAEGACSPTGPVSGPGYDCYATGTSTSCSSYSRRDYPYKCDAAAGASLYCGSEYFLEMADYDETTTCNGGGPCDC